MSRNYTVRTLRGQPQRTKVVCTLGPASNTLETIGALIDAGMSVARLNLSHGSHDQHRQVYETVRQAARDRRRSIGVLLDLSGPKIRCREIEGGAITLKANAEIRFVRGDGLGTAHALTTTYDAFVDDVAVGDPIYLDDGAIQLSVLGKDADSVTCRVEIGGRLKSRKGINLPGTRVSAPALTEKDARDLEFGISLGVDFIALSFVRDAAEMLDLKARLDKAGCPARTVAKIEKPSALDKLDAIIEASDAIMVARGDLGIELPVEKVPLVQKRIIRACRRALKPVIVATQMLESMIEHPRPTRAEVSDIANAIEDGADALMLSAETASGTWPIEAARTMASVARDVEKEIAERALNSTFLRDTAGDPQRKAMVMGAALMADALDAKFIVVRSESGETARYLSKIRGRCPIIAAHPDDAVLRRHALLWGVLPVHTEVAGKEGPSMEAELKRLAQGVLAEGLVNPTDTIIVVSRYPWGEQLPPNSLRAIRIDEALAG